MIAKIPTEVCDTCRKPIDTTPDVYRGEFVAFPNLVRLHNNERDLSRQDKIAICPRCVGRALLFALEVMSHRARADWVELLRQDREASRP